MGLVDEMSLLHYVAMTLLLQISTPPTIDRDVVNLIWKTDAALMDMWQAHSGWAKEFNSKPRNAPDVVEQHKQVVVYWLGVEDAYFKWRRLKIRDGEMSGKVISIKTITSKRTLLLRIGGFSREVSYIDLPYQSKRWKRFKDRLADFRELMEGV